MDKQLAGLARGQVPAKKDLLAYIMCLYEESAIVWVRWDDLEATEMLMFSKMLKSLDFNEKFWTMIELQVYYV